MLPHLHVHLEPEQRKRALLGLDAVRHHDRHQFFASHRLGGENRTRVSGDNLSEFLLQVHAEQRRQGVTHVELRLSPRRFMLDGLALGDFLTLAGETMAGLKDPVVFGVLLINRDSPSRLIDLFRAALPGLPASFVGIDLAGDEIQHGDVGPFVPLFAEARQHGLGVTVHAGEFGGVNDIWRAVDELGAQRVGHAVAAPRSAALMRRLHTDQVLVECSMTSNLALLAVEKAIEHPIRALHQAAIPFSLNTDIPVQTGFSIADEFALASNTLGISLDEVDQLQRRAVDFMFAPGPRARADAARRSRTP